MKRKMQMIQFVSIVNWIQMKLMTMIDIPAMIGALLIWGGWGWEILGWDGGNGEIVTEKKKKKRYK
jgi:hypothetical protein